MDKFLELLVAMLVISVSKMGNAQDPTEEYYNEFAQLQGIWNSLVELGKELDEERKQIQVALFDAAILQLQKGNFYWAEIFIRLALKF